MYPFLYSRFLLITAGLSLFYMGINGISGLFGQIQQPAWMTFLQLLLSASLLYVTYSEWKNMNKCSKALRDVQEFEQSITTK